MATNQDTKVVTGKVRLSYVHLFEPWASDADEEKKFSTMILVPKTDKRTVKALRDAEKVALEAGKSVFGGKIPAGAASIIHDCDEEDDLEEYPEREGHYRLSVSSKTRPGIVDQNVSDILDSTEVYSGCYARVSINAFAYNVKGKKGVSFGLNHVQKVADGEFLGGRSRAEDDFEPVDDDGDLI
jgi:hypothetical protein